MYNIVIFKIKLNIRGLTLEKTKLFWIFGVGRYAAILDRHPGRETLGEVTREKNTFFDRCQKLEWLSPFSSSFPVVF